MSDNVIRLHFTARPMRVADRSSAPFVLEAREGKWTIHADTGRLTAEDLVAAADTLRTIARDLTAKAHACAGIEPNHCLAEFVLHENGGIDHWVSDSVRSAADRARLKLGLRKAITSVRE